MSRRKPLRSPRLERKARRKRSRKIAALSLGALMVAGLAVYGLSRPELRLRSVEVVGADRVSAEVVNARVQDALSRTILGFIPSSHVLFYPKTELTASLLKEFPALSNVAFSLQGFSSLRVFLHEREPRALWCAGTECLLLDEMGLAFAPAEESAERLYYQLSGEGTAVLPGTEVISRERLSELLLFLRKLENAGFTVERVLLKEQGELDVALRGGTRLLLREGQYERSLVNLKTLLAADGLSLTKDGSLSASYIDLRYGNKIYFKPQ